MASIRILSAGAPKEAVKQCAGAFHLEAKREVAIEFATAPEIRKLVDEGSVTADIVVAPRGSMATFAERGQINPASLVVLGSVTTGVAVRNGSADPDISSVENFRAALLAAGELVFNTASSGRHVETMMENLGIADVVESKTVRVVNGAEVLKYLARNNVDRTIGFGQITEIRLHEHLGVHLVGPLPAEIGNVTTYVAGVHANASDPQGAAAMLAFMVSRRGKRIFAETGVI